MELFKHPKQVCMTYFEHFYFSMEMAYILGLGSFKAIIQPIGCMVINGDLTMTGGHEVATKFRRAPNGRRLARRESQRA